MTRRSLAATFAVGYLLAAACHLHAQTVTTVMTGLDNPRGLAFGPGGALFVAEAGRGGDGPSVFARGELRSYGPSGAITRLKSGRQERVVTGLPSHIGGTSGEVTGPHDISLLGNGQAYVTIGLGFDPTLRAGMGPVGDQFGRLARVLPSGQWRLEEDFGTFEIDENPDGIPLLNSNPYGLLVLPGTRIVVDAGMNAILKVESGGEPEILAVFPTQRNPLFPGFGPPRFESVPTSIARGPDGALYVGQLTGFPFPAGAASVFRMAPGEAPVPFLGGFKTIIDLDFGPDGSLYVLQHVTGPVLSGPGAIIRVAPDGTRTPIFRPDNNPLQRPTSIVVGPDGAIYVSNRGSSVGTGEVLRVTP